MLKESRSANICLDSSPNWYVLRQPTDRLRHRLTRRRPSDGRPEHASDDRQRHIRTTSSVSSAFDLRKPSRVTTPPWGEVVLKTAFAKPGS